MRDDSAALSVRFQKRSRFVHREDKVATTNNKSIKNSNGKIGIHVNKGGRTEKTEKKNKQREKHETTQIHMGQTSEQHE